MKKDRLMKDREVCERMRCGRSTLWRWVKDGDFPKPLKIGGMTRWKESVVEGVIDAAEAKANSEVV